MESDLWDEENMLLLVFLSTLESPPIGTAFHHQQDQKLKKSLRRAGEGGPDDKRINMDHY